MKRKGEKKTPGERSHRIQLIGFYIRNSGIAYCKLPFLVWGIATLEEEGAPGEHGIAQQQSRLERTCEEQSHVY